MVPVACLILTIVDALQPGPARSLAPHAVFRRHVTHVRLGALSASDAAPLSPARDDGQPLPGIKAGYALTATATTVAWGACAVRALTYHPHLQLPPIHNILTTAGAFSACPLFLSVFAALASASNAGWKRLRSQTYRRLNLSLAAASVWCALTALGASGLSAGRTSYPPPILAATLFAHLSTALFCVRVWALSLNGSPPTIARVVRGTLGSLWRLAPATCVDDPDDARAVDGRNEYATLAAFFGLSTAMAIFAPFPLATVPSFLGRRLSRAYGGWLLLAAAMSYALKDAAERGRLSASTFRTLNRGLAASSAFHLAVTVAKFVLDDILGFYANALAVMPASIASLAMYVLALFICASKAVVKKSE